MKKPEIKATYKRKSTKFQKDREQREEDKSIKNKQMKTERKIENPFVR